MLTQLRRRFNSTESYVSLVLGLAVVLLLGSLVFNYVSGKRQAEEKAAEVKKQEQLTPPTTHTVTDGETLWSISEKFYQTGYNWVDLAKSNNLIDADHIEVGQTLTVPVVTPIMPSESQISATGIAAQPTPATYTVVSGDTLWAISLTHYGTGYRWVDIAKTNNLANPDLIHSGNVLTLP